MIYLNKMTPHDTAGQEVTPRTSYERNKEGKLNVVLHQVFFFNLTPQKSQTAVLFFISVFIRFKIRVKKAIIFILLSKIKIGRKIATAVEVLVAKGKFSRQSERMKNTFHLCKPRSG